MKQDIVPKKLVPDILFEALDKNNKVFKVKVDSPELQGKGFLINRAGSRDLLIQHRDQSFAYYDAKDHKNALSNFGEMTFSDASRVKEILSGFVPDDRRPQNDEQAMFDKAKSDVKTYYSDISKLIDLPPLTDDGIAQSPNRLHSGKFQSSTIQWYQDLAGKLKDLLATIQYQSEQLPYLKENLAPSVVGFNTFDVNKESEKQYHGKSTVLDKLSIAVERNKTLIDCGMLISANYNPRTHSVTVDVFNQSMRKIASAESHALVVSKTESSAPEELTFSCGEGTRLISDQVSFQDASWNLSGNQQVAQHITDALSDIDPSSLSFIVDTAIYDRDNELVTDLERIDFYEDPVAVAAQDLVSKGMNVLALGDLDKEQGALRLTHHCQQQIGDVMSSLRVVMPQSPKVEYNHDSELGHS